MDGIVGDVSGIIADAIINYKYWNPQYPVIAELEASLKHQLLELLIKGLTKYMNCDNVSVVINLWRLCSMSQIVQRRWLQRTLSQF